MDQNGTQPVQPVQPVPPVEPIPPVQPVMPEVAQPVVVQPTQPVQQPALSATDPITMPEPVKEPDPVETELNTPIKAAEPVPGSIGSAVSMPGDGTLPNQVPGMQPIDMNMAPEQAQAMAKKQSSRKTLIILCAIAGVVVVALIGVLIFLINKK